MPIPVQHIVHLNLNVGDIAEGLRVFVDVIGLQVLGRMRAEPQDGAGMGLEGFVQWDGHSVHDHRLWGGTMIDLLEWRQPRTACSAWRAPQHTGFGCLLVDVPDLDAVYRRAARAGVHCCSAPLADTRGRRLFRLRCADGAFVELREASGPVELAGVVLNCRELERSRDWYCTQLGFTATGAATLEREDGESWGVRGAMRRRRVALAPPAAHEGGFRVVLQQWLNPPGEGAALVRANEAGFYRLALAVTDAHACHAALRAAGVDCPYAPVWLDMGPEVPVEGLWALFFRDPDGNCVELIQTPELRAT